MIAQIKYKFLTSLILCIIFISISYPQIDAPNQDDPTGVIAKQIVSVVESQFGKEYGVAFSVLDSVIKRNESSSEGGEMTDPYNTLKGCILFGADKDLIADDEHGMMGIFKNGQLIWHSDSIFKGVWYGVFSTKDINHDGKVDILVEWHPTGQIMVTNLWIISWDGSKGTIINQIDYRNGNSTLISSAEMFQLIEVNKLSPLLIKGYWSEEDQFSGYFPKTKISMHPWVTYSWDGKQYKLDLKEK